MQAVCQISARPEPVLLFARRHGRDYMMRSEKRTSYGSGSAPHGQKPPRRRRRRAGFFYILLSLLLSVLIWPIGMIMLWRRKVRWRITTKLLASIITLVLFVTLYGFGLTVQTDNPTVTMVQDKANDFLDASAVFISDGYQVICDKAVEGWETAADVADGAGRAVLTILADGIDRGVELGGRVKETVSGLFESEDSPAEPTFTPSAEPSTAPSEEPTEAPAETPTAKPSEAPADVPTAASTAETSNSAEPAASDTLAPTDAPAEPSATLALTAPSGTPDPSSAEAIGNGSLSRSREFTEASPTPAVEPTQAPGTVEASIEPSAETQSTPAPTETPEPSASPTPLPEPELKSAGEAVVYLAL